MLISSKHAQSAIDLFFNKWKFKLNDTGPNSYHLGYDFACNRKYELCLAPLKHVKNISDSDVSIFGHKPKESFNLPLKKYDHPDLYSTEFLDADRDQQC